jgi:hypothetical protein
MQNKYPLESPALVKSGIDGASPQPKRYGRRDKNATKPTWTDWLAAYAWRRRGWKLKSAWHNLMVKIKD